MTSLTITGLPMAKVPSILSALGLWLIANRYSKGPVQMHWKNELPVLNFIQETKMDQLVSWVVTEANKRCFWAPSEISSEMKKADLKQMTPHEAWKKCFAKNDPDLREFIQGIGTDQLLIRVDMRKKGEKDGKEPEKYEYGISTTPFLMILRTPNWYTRLNTLLNAVTEYRVGEALTNDTWKCYPGQDFGMVTAYFPQKVESNKIDLGLNLKASGKLLNFDKTWLEKRIDAPASDVEQKDRKILPKSEETTLPVQVALAILSWRLFPCYLQGNIVMAPGWQISSHSSSRPDKLFLPVWNKPLCLEEFKRLTTNTKLLNPKHNDVWQAFGLDAVVEYHVKSILIDGKSKFFFSLNPTVHRS